jgi:hypothetical protein
MNNWRFRSGFRQWKEPFILNKLLYYSTHASHSLLSIIAENVVPFIKFTEINLAQIP